jgi:hypothetical protein
MSSPSLFLTQDCLRNAEGAQHEVAFTLFGNWQGADSCVIMGKFLHGSPKEAP